MPPVSNRSRREESENPGISLPYCRMWVTYVAIIKEKYLSVDAVLKVRIRHAELVSASSSF